MSSRPACFALGAAVALCGVPLEAQTVPSLPPADRERLLEAFRVGDLLRGRLWSGWQTTPLPVLLVTDSVEYLLGHPRPTAEFRRLDGEAVAGREVLARPRVLPPTLLATFPAVGGMPTAVVGTPERTGKPSAEWVLAVLHEQFHQWQYSRPSYYEGVAALDLAGGDTTGQWMLDFPFPYDSPPVQAALQRLADALVRRDPQQAAAARRGARAALTDRQERYLEFQLWQEGVARWVELAAARAAAAGPAPGQGFRRLPDYEPYAQVAARLDRRLRTELEDLRLGERRRTAFYPLGAAMAELLQSTQVTWKRRYAEEPYRLGEMLR